MQSKVFNTKGLSLRAAEGSEIQKIARRKKAFIYMKVPQRKLLLPLKNPFKHLEGF